MRWDAMRAYETQRECTEKATQAAQEPANKAWDFRCLPDTIDPRGPKGK